MRTETKKEFTFKYPDEIGFAFMPCLVIVTSATLGEQLSLSRLDLTITSGDKTFTCKSNGFKGHIVVDFREYIQAFFDGIKFGIGSYGKGHELSKNGIDVTVTAEIANGDFTLAETSFSTFYVWGAMKANETWGAVDRLVWFKNYPFSFGVFASSDTTILISSGDSPSRYEKIDRGINEITSDKFPCNGEDHSTIYNYDGEIKQATFDNTFDLTFYLTGGKQSRILRIDYDDSDCGHYLRWIDRHGFYRYWLFMEGQSQRDVSTDGEFIRNNLMEYDGTFGYMGANGRRQAYQREDTVEICAPMVDSERFDFLQDVTTSPVVDLYLGDNKWQSVTIKAGTYTKTGAVLQDFICDMVINNTYIQRL